MLLRSVRIDKTSMDYAYVSVISVRCGESISMWNRFYKHNQSEEINGIAVDSVDEENVQDHYAYLLQTREKNFENAFVEHSSSKLSKLYREYANKVNTILEYQNNTSLANKFHSLQYNSSGKTCDGCFLQMSIKTFAKVPRNELLLRKFVGNRETLEIYTPDTPHYPKRIKKYDVTSIYAIYGRNRFFTIPELLYRNRGHIIIIVMDTANKEKVYLEYIRNHYLPSRLTLLLYLVQKNHKYYNHFPVNYLRSLGISNVNTSHYIVMDMDLHMSMNAYYEMTHLPRFIYESNNSAVILPVFFINNILTNCNSTTSCAYLASALHPSNKMELIMCIHHKLCTSEKNMIRTHVWDRFPSEA